MKNLSKKIAALALLLICFQSFMFSKEMSLLELNKEVLSLKYELYQMENKLGEYEDMSSFKLFFEKTKKESILRKREAELKKRNAENTAEAKKALEQAEKELSSTFEQAEKNLDQLGKDIGDALNNFFN